MKTLDRSRLKTLMVRETALFARAHPKSAALFQSARRSMPGGVPMNWMSKWPGGFPLFVARAKGARFTDADGLRYADFCLGDTGAMTGHAPPAAVKVLRSRLGRGLTAMLPTEDALAVGAELTRRVGLPYWQFALTATDANRFSLRLARMITRRPKVLVFNYCYHGTVDEAFVTLQDGKTRRRGGGGFRTGTLHAPLRPEPGSAADALSQHGPDEPRDDGRGRGQAREGVSFGFAGA